MVLYEDTNSLIAESDGFSSKAIVLFLIPTLYILSLLLSSTIISCFEATKLFHAPLSHSPKPRTFLPSNLIISVF